MRKKLLKNGSLNIFQPTPLRTLLDKKKRKQSAYDYANSKLYVYIFRRINPQQIKLK